MEESKRCSKCGERKSLIEFHAHTTTKDGLDCRCKECVSLATKQLKAKRKALGLCIRGCGNESRKSLCEDCSAKDKQRKANAKAMGLCVTCYRAARSGKVLCEKCNAKRTQYIKTDLGNAKKKASRFRSLGGVFISGEDILARGRSQGWRCALTGRPITIHTCEPDHVIARARGGPSSLSNLQLLEAQVNRAKGKLSNYEFIQLCKEVVAYRCVDAEDYEADEEYDAA